MLQSNKEINPFAVMGFIRVHAQCLPVMRGARHCVPAKRQIMTRRTHHAQQKG